MRKRLIMTLALGTALAVVVAGLATAAGNHKPVVIQEGNLKVTADGGFSPTAVADRPQHQRQDRDHRRHSSAGAEGIHRRNGQERHDQRQGPAKVHHQQTCGEGNQSR
jgi:hypothetical protein